MKSDLTVIPPSAERTTDRERAEDPGPEVGKWYWHTDKDGRILVCVTRVGSNYVKLKGPSDERDSQYSFRVHLDNFDERCEFVPDPTPYIDNKIKTHWGNAQELMGKVAALTAQLGVTPRGQLNDSNETQALALRRDEPLEEYKKALIKAKKDTLPKLFKKIEQENDVAASWMKAKLIPLKAAAGGMKKSIDRIEDRIFSVELYAGLIERVVQVSKGKPAPLDTPVHIMQRRHYMDEECLVGYEHGGMDFKNVKDFDRWLCKPRNRDRILPFPRTVVAFRIRRERKYREAESLAEYISLWEEENADKKTLLYLRNGEQVFRLETGIEFDEQLFPAEDQRVLGQGKLWGRVFAARVKDVITDDEYQARLAEAKEKMKAKDDNGWHPDEWNLRELRDDWKPFDKASVYHDDIRDLIEKRAKEHNRLVLVLQGLLDRSPVFHPHPPWQLWTSAGFDTGIKLIFDDTRALSAGEKPDFDAYRAKLNAYLMAGSLTVGQEDVWERVEAIKYNRRETHREFQKLRYQPAGNPGPGRLARVVRFTKSGVCRYEWERKSQRMRKYGYTEDKILKAQLSVREHHVLNIDAYKPGDFHIFFDDPRTRQEYLEWAPLLLEAEECHAGNRKLKPMSLHGPPPRKPPVYRKRHHTDDDERDEDAAPELIVPKARTPRPPVGSQYNNVLVALKWDTETTAGTKFKAGELMKVCSYYRKKLSLEAVKGKGRFIRGVGISSVTIVGKQ